MLIKADPNSADWAGLVRRCNEVMSRRLDIGMWVPSIDYTPFPIDLVAVGADHDGLSDRAVGTNLVVVSTPMLQLFAGIGNMTHGSTPLERDGFR